MIEDDLEPLITQCPNCSTRFRVTESQLQVAAGRVRCGACLTVFQGIDFLLLDEESTFSTEGEAADALDALLDELEEEGGAEPEPVSQDRGATALITGSTAAESDQLTVPIEPRQLYGGFEEDGDPEVEDGDQEVAQEIEDGDQEVEDGDQEVEDGDPEVEDGDQEVEDGDQEVEDADQEVEDADQEIEVADQEIEVADQEIEVADQEIEVADQELETLDSEFEWASETAAAESASSDTDQTSSDPGEAAAPREISFAPEPRRWWVGLVMGLFVVALVGQVFLYQLPSWGKDPDLRGLYEAGCTLLGCELPIMQDLDQMRASSLVVRSHPELVGALVVDAVIVNGAPYSQPFPDLELRFSAVGGTLVAGRRFTPAEYLAGEMLNAEQVPPMTPIQVSLEIEDPGEEAVNYTLTFR